MNQNNDPSPNLDTGGNPIKQYWQPNKSHHTDNNTPIASTRGATAMLLPNGRVIAWENNNKGNGGQVPPEIAKLQDIASLSASRNSFTVLRSDGQKVGWDSTDDNKLHYEYDY
ncbi:hypothetical protein [Photorhabdus luminescens]|uniref:Uncharacterized protein n=1 Tax=Photorhabdus luminescens subsp. mexicana TaxID=2100167 RepID=A0A4R4J7J9_PHOLU|nr:hypothetical protein [Photorhabdus luminescens]TDB48699.1 hypothetical protein C5468_15035 [Photorhabdus luminescens subsp. mexicana]